MRRLTGAAWVTLILVGAGAATPLASRDAALDSLLDRVGRYVAGYGEQASLIIAVEHYRQRYADARLGEPSQRDTVAEVALVRTGDATGWIGFRDVISVDGKPIGDRQDRLQRLFRGGTPDLAEARRIADESARFNIGPNRRNFNEPTAALFFLLPRNQARLAFTRRKTTVSDGVTATELEFKEVASPTFVRTSDGHDVPSEGKIWVDPSDGTVLRTRLVLSGARGMGDRARVEVEFAPDTRLHLWLPVTMTERHEGTMRGQTARLAPFTVTGTATYGDFKRFETSTSVDFKE